MDKSETVKIRVTPDLKAALRDRAKFLKLKEAETSRAALALGLSVMNPKPAADDSDRPAPVGAMSA